MKKIILLLFLIALLHSITQGQHTITYDQFIELVHKGDTIKNYIVGPPSEELIDSCLYGKTTDIIKLDHLFVLGCSFERICLSNLSVKTVLVFADCHIRNAEPTYEFYESYSGDVIFSGIDVGGQCNLLNFNKSKEPVFFEIEESMISNLSIAAENSDSFTCYLRISTTEILHSFYCSGVKMKALEFHEVIFCQEPERRSSDWFSIENAPNGIIWNDLTKQETENLYITDCAFYTPVQFSEINIPGEFTISDTKFHKGIDLTNARFNPATTQLQWSSLSKSLISTVDEDSIKFHNIQNSYLILIDYYRTKNLANARKQCFIEYKDFEREHYGKQVTQGGLRGSARNTVTYFFLSALKWTSNYSTDFILTIWRTTVLIGLFGLFYFFYNTLLYNNFKIYFYFRQKNNRRSIRAAFKMSQHILRKTYHFFGATLSEYNFREKRILILQMNETSLLKFTWRYFIREFVVSFFASLNFFVTLGFAGVSLNGKLKYVAIIEGLMGWLILVILSAALVNSFIMI